MEYGVSGNRGKYRDGKTFKTFREAKEYAEHIVKKGYVTEAGVYEIK